MALSSNQPPTNTNTKPIPQAPVTSSAQFTMPTPTKPNSNSIQNPTSYKQPVDNVVVRSYTEQHAGKSSFRSEPFNAQKLIVGLIFSVLIMFLILLFLLQ